MKKYYFILIFVCVVFSGFADDTVEWNREVLGGSYKVHVNLAQTTMFMLSLGLIDKNMLLDLDSLGEEHQALEPNLQTGMTPLGEYTRLGSQVEMSKTPEYWDDPLICPIGSCKPEWLKK